MQKPQNNVAPFVLGAPVWAGASYLVRGALDLSLYISRLCVRYSQLFIDRLKSCERTILLRGQPPASQQGEPRGSEGSLGGNQTPSSPAPHIHRFSLEPLVPCWLNYASGPSVSVGSDLEFLSFLSLAFPFPT